MKICKFMQHRGVDKMLKAALGDKLQLYRHSQDTFSWVDTGEVEFIDSDIPEDIEWDAIIVDNIETWDFLHNSGIRTRNKIWYVHGTYSNWLGFQQDANKKFKGYHTIFTDFARRDSVLKWFKNEVESTLVLPIHLTPDYFVEPKESKNGKCCIIGNRLLSGCRLNDNYSIVGKTIKSVHEFLGDDRLQIYGWNDHKEDQETRLASLPKNCVKESIVIKDLGNYSVSYHPSFVPTLSFVQLEVMAAGIAVVTTPKVDFISDGFFPPAFHICSTTEEFMDAITKLTEDSEYSYEVGRIGQEYIKRKFPFDFYKETLNSYLEDFLK